jgi:phosphatidylglycerol:prolipoprotein diacylglycerol transferase
MLLVAVAVCLVLVPPCAKALEGLDSRRTRRLLLGLVVVPFVGGRMHFVLNQWQLFHGRPLSALAVWSGGIHAGGAVLATALALPFFTRRYGLPLAKLADAIVPAAGLGIALARLGCFLQGCCFGTLCERVWCVRFPSTAFVYHLHALQGLLPEGATASRAVHPLQLYFAGIGVAVALLALWLLPRKRFDGEVALGALLVFGATSAVLEPFRAEYYPRAYWGALPQLQWTALGLTAASAIALAGASLVHRRRAGIRDAVLHERALT